MPILKKIAYLTAPIPRGVGVEWPIKEAIELPQGYRNEIDYSIID